MTLSIELTRSHAIIHGHAVLSINSICSGLGYVASQLRMTSAQTFAALQCTGSSHACPTLWMWLGPAFMRWTLKVQSVF